MSEKVETLSFQHSAYPVNSIITLDILRAVKGPTEIFDAIFLRQRNILCSKTRSYNVDRVLTRRAKHDADRLASLHFGVAYKQSCMFRLCSLQWKSFSPRSCRFWRCIIHL